jgi:hypothetical protein
MSLMKSAAIATGIIGLGIIVTAFVSPPLQAKLALVLAGLALISIGVLLAKLTESRKRDVDRFGDLVARLDAIEQELQKKEEPKNRGVAIADVISSGLKYYAEHMNRSKEEEKDD